VGQLNFIKIAIFLLHNSFYSLRFQGKPYVLSYHEAVGLQNLEKQDKLRPELEKKSYCYLIRTFLITDNKVFEWSQQTVEIPARTSFKLFLEATTEIEETQSASLDSLSLKNEADLLISCDEPIPEPSTAIPSPTTDPTASSNCRFEND
jgi:hypothetical protein